jgi:uncharacterized membrane protein
MLVMWIVTALPLAFLCVLLFILPGLSRRSQFFAVTVPPDFRETAEALRVIRKYRIQVAAHSALATAGFLLAVAWRAPAWLVLAFLWPPAGALLAVVLAHRQALRYAVPASGVHEASLQRRPASVPGSPYLWAGPFGILGVAGAWIGAHWNEIPARFPIHWGFDNQPNGWATRSVAGVYTPLAIEAAVCVMMLFLNWQIARNSRGSTAMRKLMGRALLVLAYLMAALFAWLSVALPLGHGAPGRINAGIIVAALAIIIGAVVVYGFRAKVDPEPGTGQASALQPVLGGGDNTADRNWIGGLFYFNPDDSALFVEKRIGIGFELNFGNPGAWVFLGFLVLIPVAAVVLTKL